MSNIKSVSNVGAVAGLIANSAEHLSQHPKHVYVVDCYGPDGVLKWSDGFENLTTTDGLNQYLNATLVTGSVAPTWYVGLINGPGAGNTYAQSDTSALHPGWTENTTYSNGTRPQWNPGAVATGSVDNSASKAVFNINGSATIAGCFMIDDSTKGGVVGILLGEGNFVSGDRSVLAGDTLNVTVTCTQS